MKNPLYKRLPRELRTDIGKAVALFLFLTLTIGFCSGFLVADGSMKRAYDDSFTAYAVENGHFTLASQAEQATLKALDKKGVSVYELFYKDKESEEEHTVRVYKPRGEVNRADLMSGRLPELESDIAIDRLYAENNGLSVGDTLNLSDREWTICGLVALSDYSALFKNNTDMMFDANKFTVALVTEGAFEELGESGLHYCYAWRNDDQSLSEPEQEEKADELLKTIAETAVLTNFVARPDNQAIMFTGDDMGGDKVMIQWLLYIVMVVLAFIFAVTTRGSIEQEASVIGTLRASGYTKGELLRHYLAMPMLITLAAAVVGNILGYTAMKNVIVGMYYHSYSLPTYTTIWNAEAFLLTTLVPCGIVLSVNLLVLSVSLSLPPLQFLRHELKKRQKKKVVRLSRGTFLSRFRIRVILQNLPAFATMFAGIFFASVLLMFGLLFSPLLRNFKSEVVNSEASAYQYLLKAPMETRTEGAEKYAVTALRNDHDEEITVYGVSPDSKYLTDMTFSEDGVLLSDGFMEKYGVRVGDRITLHQKFGEEEYTFTVSGSYHYPAALCVFMPREEFNTAFDKETDDFSGYFTDSRLTDIEEAYIASVITEHDLTIIADQLEDSMGLIFPMFGGFAVILYILMIYLLAKLVVEKNAFSISMLKILGYTNREAGRLYNTATAIVVGVSLVVSVPLCQTVIRGIYYVMMQDFSGWLTYYVAPWIYPAMLGIGAACYLVVHGIQMRKIEKIPLSQALKTME